MLEILDTFAYQFTNFTVVDLFTAAKILARDYFELQNFMVVPMFFPSSTWLIFLSFLCFLIYFLRKESMSVRLVFA